MTKGYIIVAQGSYVNMAELLARSIKATQSTVNNVSLITDSSGSDIFDHIIPIDNQNDYMLNRTKIYDLSPYDETVMLDADMLFFDDVSHWWNHLDRFPLLITNRVKTYRDSWATTPYRNTFIKNNLTNCYSAFTYFKKDPLAKEFFDLLKIIIAHWDQWAYRYAPVHRQTWPSIDLAMAIAVKALALEGQVFTSVDYPTFTHMKSECQGFGKGTDWIDHLARNVKPGELKLGNYKQTGILHYVDKDMVNELSRIF
jgi:hypothetical protein